MANALTTDRTVVADDDILASDYNNARADLHSVAEGFYDAGTPDLPLAMQVVGVHWSDPTSKAFRFFRQTATGADARAKSSPLRPIWHYNDRTGDPADDARVAEGDLLVYDDGTSSRFLKACKNVGGVRSFYGLGVRADNRTTATSGSPSQNSDRVAVRSQIWQGSTQTREWFLRSEDVNASGSFASFLSVRFQVQGSSDEVEAWRVSKSRAWTNGSDLCLDDMTFESRQTSVSLGSSIVDGFAGSIRTGGGYFGDAVTRHNHWDVPDVQTSSGATVADACLFRFPVAAGTHKALAAAAGGAHAWLQHNEAGTIRYEPWFDAKQLEARWTTAATGGGTLQNSGDFRWRGSYWNGSAATDFYAYSRIVMDATTPSAHWRLGFSSGTSTLDFYNSGSLWVRGMSGESVWLTQEHDATSGEKDVGSIALVLRGTSWDGAAAAARGSAQVVTIDSPADASDTWMHRFLAVEDGALLLGIDQLGRIVVGDNATAAFRLDAALGTHPATTNADKTGNAKTGTLKVVDSSGTILGHIQLYAD